MNGLHALFDIEYQSHKKVTCYLVVEPIDARTSILGRGEEQVLYRQEAAGIPIEIIQIICSGRQDISDFRLAYGKCTNLFDQALLETHLACRSKIKRIR